MSHSTFRVRIREARQMELLQFVLSSRHLTLRQRVRVAYHALRTVGGAA